MKHRNLIFCLRKVDFSSILFKIKCLKLLFFCQDILIQRLSLSATEPDVIAVGLERLYIVNGPYFLCGIMEIFTGVLRGIGYSLIPMVVSILGACAFRILWVATIFRIFPTMECLMISYPVSWLLTLVVLAIIFLRIWKRMRKTFTPDELSRT